MQKFALRKIHRLLLPELALQKTRGYGSPAIPRGNGKQLADAGINT
jgi:hypothetical protein